jgi:F0F1-type ATP synthase assembly protein I
MMPAIEPVWSELIASVVGAVLGWFAKHFTGRRR